MRHYRLKEEERALHGYTDLLVVDHTDFTETTNDTAQTLTLLELVSEDIVRGDLVADVREAVAGLTAANLTAGFGSAGNSSQLLSSQDATTQRVHIGTSADTRQDGSEDLTVTLDPGANGENLAQTTAGEIWIWVRLWRASDRDQMNA